ncbi:winged helix-turn-helix transcriptional regulator [Piscinibacter aquaticus]|uniref:Winged helix-turn-helix transcriptional regulator n=1 Tax=Piscinibacter aquaticus TaxID=392597 RepID=A0A5C6U3H1_9BURK|nr:winged helix-turn-helix transcriptional regulator [Piscinibacter aquaticus]
MEQTLMLDAERPLALVHGRPVGLTPLEWRVARRLADEDGRAVTRAEIARLIGGEAGDASDNAVAVHLYNLRRKLGRDVIETIRGRGFRLKR